MCHGEGILLNGLLYHSFPWCYDTFACASSFCFADCRNPASDISEFDENEKYMVANLISLQCFDGIDGRVNTVLVH
jgi:hypothetical protein